MQKFEFPLERLLKIRRQQERLAELEVMRAIAAVDAAKARVEELREKLRRHSEQMTQFVGRTLSPHEWVAGCDFSNHLGQSITQALKEVGLAEQRVAEASAKRTEVASEAEAMQSLRDQQYSQFKQELQKFDQERVDEAGLRRWLASAPERE
ncbi:flagellar export protein FliJ [Zavarzinella formosa]|uniref:flagellar export protein FliJ n=1 Tax=Zavarzinella formosa TaxID=360055 RepID=UPI0003130EA5|nr:flagellar export protein FliJ [Zavarzinella formosa]